MVGSACQQGQRAQRRGPYGLIAMEGGIPPCVTTTGASAAPIVLLHFLHVSVPYGAICTFCTFAPGHGLTPNLDVPAILKMRCSRSACFFRS